jgi:Tol biopolymer transport system component
MDLDGKNRKELFSSSTEIIWPRYSPDGKKILFSTAGKLFIMDSAGQNQRQLSSQQGPGIFHCFSPDGKWILFLAYQADGHYIFMVDIEGKSEEQLSNTRGAQIASFSCDSKYIIYSQGPSVFLINGQTRDVKFLARGIVPSWFPNFK